MSEYHDKEWGRVTHDSRELWETLMLEGFQAGLSWQIVLHKRDEFRKAFHQFDAKKVARMTDRDVERLMQNPGIVRARAKIEATIKGARVFVEMEKNGEDFSKWVPAIAIQDESYLIEGPFGSSTFTREAGEVLHPERDSLQTYREIRETIGEYNFQSQYQQSPQTREGGLIKREWIKFCEPQDWPKNFDYVLQSWDTANKSGERNDYSVCTTWGRNEGNLYLLDVFRKRLTFPELKCAALELFRKYPVQRLLVEDKGSGISLIQELRSEYVWCLEPHTPTQGSDKQMRLDAQSIKFESGRVHLPSHAPWLDEYVREITGFPGGKYDDQVDSTSQALEYLGPMPDPANFRPYRRPQYGYESS